MKQILCTVCHEKLAMVNRSSIIWPDVSMFVCYRCDKLDLEPRAFVIISAKSAGLESVEPFLKHHRYYGSDIMASELV